MLRWGSSIHNFRRDAMADTEIRGQAIAEGDKIVMYYLSANRDDEVFDEPFRFDVTRHPNKHLGFGWAEHFCLGAHLARASTQALVHELARRVESLELAGPIVQTESSFVVGLKSLPVRYRLRAPD
jgi:cholest-4-en-3-one 26-monooxygenase